jgi:hypothetical protein
MNYEPITINGVSFIFKPSLEGGYFDAEYLIRVKKIKDVKFSFENEGRQYFYNIDSETGKPFFNITNGIYDGIISHE